MLKLLINIICFFIILVQFNTAFSQEEPVKPKPKPNNNNSQQNNTNKLTLKITPNLTCKLKIDGEDKGIIPADEIKKVFLNKGTFLIIAVSTENPLDKYSEELIVNEVNIEKLYRIDLLKIRNSRIALEQEELDVKAAAIAKKKSDSIAIANKLIESKQILDDISNNMVFVQGGTFSMGCTSEQGKDCDSDEKPVHSVTVGDYYIGKYEVTQKQWRSVMGASDSLSSQSFFKYCNDCPVESVSWDDIQDFLSKLSQLSGKTYRLPTEAEWEFAARGGNKSIGYKYSGSNSINEVAWYEGNSGNKTHEVGQKQANELGIYDMSGNVWEWCSDWYGCYSSGSQTNPKGASSGYYHVFRGGSWRNNSANCRNANRRYDGFGSNMGFRVVFVP